MDTTPQVIAALLALGMALSFIVADRQSPTSRMLALFLTAVGVSIALSSMVELPLIRGRAYPWWGGIFAVPEVLAFVFAYEWVLRVRRTIPSRNLTTGFADNQLRIAQALAILYGVLALSFPRVRAEQFINLAFSSSELGPGFFLFATPLAVSLLLGVAAGLLTLRRRPDLAERLRLVAFAAAAPFMASGMVVPVELAPVLTAVGLLIFLVGAIEFHVIQGQRAQFLSRFLAPQVAELVREQGLKSATREQTLELSVVCCDLRGFTAFSAATESKKVIGILREYYDAVGAAALNVGGTIKDQAGDGVLILVGAPIHFEDHAQRALDLAKRIRESGVALTARWSDGNLQLGVGVGTASGFVTVGVIGGASRLEYTAVGPAVNLASRLCSEAAHGDVLVDERTTELLGSAETRAALRPCAPLKLKGFRDPVPNYALASA
ncbi:MAG: adenylate/guanylate cyclase domain-containing protein [Betaproteobacteria bacterium]